MRRLSLRNRLLILVAIGAAVLASAAYATSSLKSIELSTVNTRFSIRGPQLPGHHIVIVALDTPSLTALNAHPPAIPRAIFARVIQRIHADHPRVISVDAQFEGPSLLGPIDDQDLLKTLAADGPIVLATHDNASGHPVPVPAGVVDAKGVVLASASVDVDSDRVLRREIYQPVETVTLPVKVAQLAGTAVSSSDFPDNHAWIDYLGPPGTFPTYSLSSVLDGHVNGGVFAHKIVLIGITDPSASQRDTFLTSVSSTPMSGVEVDANAVWTILHGFPLFQPVSGAVNLLLIIVLATLPALLAVRFTDTGTVLYSFRQPYSFCFCCWPNLPSTLAGSLMRRIPSSPLCWGCPGAVAPWNPASRNGIRHVFDAALGPRPR